MGFCCTHAKPKCINDKSVCNKREGYSTAIIVKKQQSSRVFFASGSELPVKKEDDDESCAWKKTLHAWLTT